MKLTPAQRRLLNRVREYLVAIPRSEWCKGKLLDRLGRRCGLGHIRHGIGYDEADDVQNVMDMAFENDTARGHPKPAVLRALDRLLKT